MEFVCTASLFLLALHWGPSGIALAWTISYFLLMFPGFAYAGKPIGLGIQPVFAVIWKFFAASGLAGIATALVVRVVPPFGTAAGALGAFARMVSVSVIFFALYLVGVIVLYRGFKPINETISLLRHLLPERVAEIAFAAAVDADGALSQGDRT
jgi:PST family polysaccharide transporter